MNLQKYNISCDLYTRYGSEADVCYDKACFDTQKIIAIAKKARLTEENQKLIAEFLCCADEDVRRFMWLYYYILFETEEHFEDELWTVVDALPFPEKWEAKYPGMMKSCIYLLASEHLEKWLSEENLGDEFLEGYFDRYRYFANLNKIECKTFGLVKLSPFLYGYAKPFMLVIGRLTYQIKSNYNYCELYENSRGERVIIATDQCRYAPDGHMHEDGTIPVYINDGKTLTGRTYDCKGRLAKDIITLDLTEYKRILSPGDKVATIHIPGNGKLDEESVQNSIDRAMEIIPRHLAPIKAFICQTWFLDPNLREVFKEGSNMMKFADRFDIICVTDNENHSLYQHIFQCARCPLGELVPQNDFQAKMLQRAKEGKKTYWSYGILKQSRKG